MAKKLVPELQRTKCAICGADIEVALYEQHVADFHKPNPQQPVAQTPAPGPQPPPAAPPSWTQPTLQSFPVTPPPPPAPRNPFVNAQMLYANGGKITGHIIGVRSSAGVRSKTRTDIAERKGWLVDIQTDIVIKAATVGPNGQLLEITTNQVCGRINEGDTRHQVMYKKYGLNWVGKAVTIRLPMPTDNTKAGWLIE